MVRVATKLKKSTGWSSPGSTGRLIFGSTVYRRRALRDLCGLLCLMLLSARSALAIYAVGVARSICSIFLLAYIVKKKIL